MRKYYDQIRNLAFSGTAKDTYILFLGNLGSAFWGFLFTLIVARGLSISDFGVFSAVLNLVIILSSLADLGISTGSVNFVADNFSKGDFKKTDEYIKASFVVRVIVVILISLIVILAAPFVSQKLLASPDPRMAIWSAVIPIFIFPVFFFQYILQAKKQFLQATIYDNSFYVARLVFAFWFYFMGMLRMEHAFWAFGFGFVVTITLTFVYLKRSFLFAKPSKNQYKNLLKFSSWIAVNRIISSISGKLDVQMLAAMLGAVATGLYSIPSRLSSFIIVLAGSFSSVLATRLASFNDKEKEKAYIIKSTLALVPITLAFILWIIVAEPFILFLFGSKYIDSVPVFQALVAAEIPFLFTVPSVSAIVYSMKKTIYIGTLSFFQIAAIFLLNYYLIPKYGVYGPTITLGITNTLLAIYVWIIVVKYYWFTSSKN